MIVCTVLGLSIRVGVLPNRVRALRRGGIGIWDVSGGETGRAKGQRTGLSPCSRTLRRPQTIAIGNSARYILVEPRAGLLCVQSLSFGRSSMDDSTQRSLELLQNPKPSVPKILKVLRAGCETILGA